MPGAPIGSRLADEDGRERAVRRAALGERRPLVDRRAHERVAQLEHHPAHADELGALGVVERLGGGAQPRRGVEDGGQVTALVGGRDEQQPLAGGRQSPHPREERALEVRADGQRSEDRLDPCGLSLR